ncbi:MAG: tetratricopeptide repeat protein, partial [Candidatus Latescibacterota bacterium]
REELARWLAGRVDEVGAGAVHVHVAQPPSSEGAGSEHGYMGIPVADFDRWTQDERAGELSAGRFIELGWYGVADEPLIRVHRRGPWEDLDLPPLFPDPARYLRRDGWLEPLR